MLDNPKGQDWRAAVEDLNQVASLAESFSDQRPRSSKSWSHLANSLDQEGVLPLIAAWRVRLVRNEINKVLIYGTYRV